MKSRYQGLRVFGTLALIIAWILLILGILSAIGLWLGIDTLAKQISTSGQGTSLSFFAALPALLFAVLGFIQFFVIGKVLHLLVDLDTTTLDVQQKVRAPMASATGSDGGADISGELKRQAKLISSNLEATQSLQQQISSLQSRLGATQTAIQAPEAPARVE